MSDLELDQQASQIVSRVHVVKEQGDMPRRSEPTYFEYDSGMQSRCCCFTNVLFIPTLFVYPMEKRVYPVSGVKRKCTMSLNPT